MVDTRMVFGLHNAVSSQPPTRHTGEVRRHGGRWSASQGKSNTAAVDGWPAGGDQIPWRLIRSAPCAHLLAVQMGHSRYPSSSELIVERFVGGLDKTWCGHQRFHGSTEESCLAQLLPTRCYGVLVCIETNPQKFMTSQVGEIPGLWDLLRPRTKHSVLRVFQPGYQPLALSEDT